MDPLGRPRLLKASAEVTNGAYTVTETSLPPGLGAPAHSHAAHEEAFYVLEGVISFSVGRDTVDARPGDFVLIPRGIEHAFDVRGGDNARYLCIFSPPITDEERKALAHQAQMADRS
jgi:quercetin dioxygenase-like cupin family protein